MVQVLAQAQWFAIPAWVSKEMLTVAVPLGVTAGVACVLMCVDKSQL